MAEALLFLPCIWSDTDTPKRILAKENRSVSCPVLCRVITACWTALFRIEFISLKFWETQSFAFFLPSVLGEIALLLSYESHFCHFAWNTNTTRQSIIVIGILGTTQSRRATCIPNKSTIEEEFLWGYSTLFRNSFLHTIRAKVASPFIVVSQGHEE